MTEPSIWIDPAGVRQVAGALDLAARELRAAQHALTLAAPAAASHPVAPLIEQAARHLERAITTHTNDADLLRSTLTAAIDADHLAASTTRWWLAERWNTAAVRQAQVAARSAYEGVATARAVMDGPLSPWTWDERWAGTHGAPETGDFGGTFSVRSLRPYPGSTQGTPAERGGEAVRHALADTSADTQVQAGGVRIWADEFELIRHTDTRYTVVLAGTQDLRGTNIGLDPHTRTPRDTDAFAVRSAGNASLDQNGYAVMVRDALDALDLPQGSQLMIVGHSYGADTAIDLAADAEFNGDRYEVTHVVAAAYHVEPHLEHVRPHTQTLVVNNSQDVVVELERTIDRVTVDGPTRNNHNAVIHRFDGGASSDLGHGQARYLERLATTTDPHVHDYFASVHAAGYTSPGWATAVDISVHAPPGVAPPRSGPELIADIIPVEAARLGRQSRSEDR